MFKFQKNKPRLSLLAVAYVGAMLFMLVAPILTFSTISLQTVYAQDGVVGPTDPTPASPSPAPSETEGGGRRQALARDCPNKEHVGEKILTKDNCGIVKYIITFIDVLSGLVGIIVTIMIVVGGIQYSASRDNPQATAAAKARITNAVIALIFFLFTFAFLQWVVPGGAFSS